MPDTCVASSTLNGGTLTGTRREKRKVDFPAHRGPAGLAENGGGGAVFQEAAGGGPFLAFQSAYTLPVFRHSFQSQDAAEGNARRQRLPECFNRFVDKLD